MPKGRGQKGTRSPRTRKPVDQVVRNPSFLSNKSVCNPHVSMVLSNHSTSQPNSPVVSQVNNLHLPVIEQTMFPSPGIYQQPPLPAPSPHTWMFGSNQRFDNWTCFGPRPYHHSVMSPYCERNYSIPRPFTPTFAMASGEGNCSSLSSTPTPNLLLHFAKFLEALKRVLVAEINIPNHQHHQMICVLSTRNGVNTFQKVHRYQNVILEMLIIILTHHVLSFDFLISSLTICKYQRTYI